ncbi:MAG: FAD-dependent oxidoreductase [Thermoplasmatales archaeon]|jgi:NADH dehydrogenase|nr:FAD-dependent oxidoreductase [Thermoplasmatales archaeon]
MMMTYQNTTNPERKSVVIIGFGFGGFSLVRSFHKQARKFGIASSIITVINKTDQLTFTPLLPMVSGGTVRPSSVIENISRTSERFGFTFVNATAKRINMQDRMVETDRGGFKFDYVVVATGSSDNFFGIPGAESNTHSLRNVSDAQFITSQSRHLVDKCRAQHTPGQRNEASFVIVGGGLSGVETALSLNNSIKQKGGDTCRYQKNGVYLIEAGERVLPKEQKSVSDISLKELISSGIHVLTGTKVSSVNQGIVHLSDGSEIVAEEVIWTAGIKPNAIAIDHQGNGEYHETGKIPVDSCLQSKEFPNVFALGDCALIFDEKGERLPENASVAVQEGEYLGKQLANIIGSGKSPRHPFKHWDLGHIIALGSDNIYVGPKKAILRGKLAGLFAFTVSMLDLFSWENRHGVLFDEIIFRLHKRKA